MSTENQIALFYQELREHPNVFVRFLQEFHLSSQSDFENLMKYKKHSLLFTRYGIAGKLSKYGDHTVGNHDLQTTYSTTDPIILVQLIDRDVFRELCMEMTIDLLQSLNNVSALSFHLEISNILSQRKTSVHKTSNLLHQDDPIDSPFPTTSNMCCYIGICYLIYRKFN
jgi:hypothetical protein